MGGASPGRRRAKRANPVNRLAGAGEPASQPNPRGDMHANNLLEEFDRDHAVQELAAEVAGDTRAGFLKKAGVGAGALVAGSAFMGAMPKIANAAAIPASDIAILNFALTLEYLEAAFYTEAVAKKKLSGETLRFAKVVAGHENAHVVFLKKVLGAKAVKKPAFDFKGTTS